jgi:DNA-binding CsgD family transcriptional regulator
MALLPLARLHLALGEQDAAAARLREAEAGIDVLDNPWLRARARVLGGMVALGAGDPTAAESLAHEALQAALERRYPKQVAEAFEVLAEVAEALESPVEAARLLGAARRLRHDAGLPGSPADVERLEALAARLQTLLGEEGFDAALGEGRQLDPAEAAEWVRRARGSRRRPSTGWESLTPTERQVVALTAQGLTNPEIGARMFISPGTVKIHLSHIFGKLGLRNRSELAAEAMRRGGDA